VQCKIELLAAAAVLAKPRDNDSRDHGSLASMAPPHRFSLAFAALAGSVIGLYLFCPPAISISPSGMRHCASFKHNNFEVVRVKPGPVADVYRTVSRGHTMTFEDKTEGETASPDKATVTLQGTVDKIIPSVNEDEPEKVQINLEGADDLYREIRVENTLTDGDGAPVSLKKGAEVEITIEADQQAIKPKV